MTNERKITARPSESVSLSSSSSDITMFSQIAELTDHLYLSSASAVKKEKIRTLGITLIINVTMDMPNVKMADVETLQIHVDDLPSARINLYFDRCADKIHQVARSKGKTLVHCVAGVSRSAAVCLAYLMKYRGMTLDKAYRLCKRQRPVVHPNVGFWKQLVDFERRIFGANTVKMVHSSAGLIPDVYKKETEHMVWLPGASRHPHYLY